MRYLLFVVIALNALTNEVLATPTVAQRTCFSAMEKATGTECTRGINGIPLFENAGEKFTDPTSPVLQNALDKCIPVLQPAAKTIFAQLVKQCAGRKVISYPKDIAAASLNYDKVKCQFDALKFAHNFEEPFIEVVNEKVETKQPPAVQRSGARP